MWLELRFSKTFQHVLTSFTKTQSMDLLGYSQEFKALPKQCSELCVWTGTAKPLMQLCILAVSTS